MSKLYFSCSAGVSGDMVLSALEALCVDKASLNAKREEVTEFITNYNHENITHAHDHSHDYKHNHSHDGRHYSEVKAIIDASTMSETAKKTAKNIYEIIAKAESKVHDTTLEDVHFHEVGRAQAISNVAGVAICIDMLGADEVLCDTIVDGTGYVQCSHGLIPVPVPAVRVMQENCDLKFETNEEIDTEMVTPTGLAILIGLGAKYCGEKPDGEVIATGEGFGRKRFFQRGLKVELIK